MPPLPEQLSGSFYWFRHQVQHLSAPVGAGLCGTLLDGSVGGSYCTGPGPSWNQSCLGHCGFRSDLICSPPSWPETPLGFWECSGICGAGETFREVLSGLDPLQNFGAGDKGGAAGTCSGTTLLVLWCFLMFFRRPDKKFHLLLFAGAQRIKQSQQWRSSFSSIYTGPLRSFRRVDGVCLRSRQVNGVLATLPPPGSA